VRAACKGAEKAEDENPEHCRTARAGKDPCHSTSLLFGSPADQLGPVALRPRLSTGLPLSRRRSASVLQV
jgi:hypothetical protein